MMKARTILLVVAGLLAFSVLAPMTARPSNGFVIENADETRTIDVTGSSALNQLIGAASPRFVIESANELQEYALQAAPGDMPLEVVARFVIEFANANQFYTLGYPMELISDDTSPQIGDISYRILTATSVVIEWATDEFAVCEVHYGTESGLYPGIQAESLFAKVHEVTLTGLTPNTTYYYIVRCTDRSNNSSASDEDVFTLVRSVYLPLVLRSTR